MNHQYHHWNLVSAKKETEKEHFTDSFTDINAVNHMTNEEVPSEVSEGFDAEYSDDKLFEAWNNDYENSDYIETYCDHE